VLIWFDAVSFYGYMGSFCPTYLHVVIELGHSLACTPVHIEYIEM